MLIKDYKICYILLVMHLEKTFCTTLEEEKYGVIFANECEVCKLVTKEIIEELNSKDSSYVIETGYNMDPKKKKKTKYNKSELKLLEALEETCKQMSDYRVHKERKDSTRWAKTMSQTFKTLHGLVNKGVKVDLGIPYDLWDEPSAEVAELKIQCDQFLETYDDMINEWFFGERESSLQNFICPNVLKNSQCLNEPYGETIKVPDLPEDGKEDSKENESLEETKRKVDEKLEKLKNREFGLDKDYNPMDEKDEL